MKKKRGKQLCHSTTLSPHFVVEFVSPERQRITGKIAAKNWCRHEALKDAQPWPNLRPEAEVAVLQEN